MRNSAMFLMCIVALGAGCTSARTPTGLAVEEVFVDGNVQVEVIDVPVVDVTTDGVVDASGFTAAVDLATGPIPITLAATNFAFAPSTIVASAGQDIAITFAGVDGEHSFVIEELGINERIREGHVVSFTAPEAPGVYPFYCGIGSHHVLGMEGTLIVK